jgi:ABC-2 type transport system permease protein
VNARIKAVARKELREFRRNKLVIFTMAILPLFFIAVPLASVLALPQGTAQSTVKAVVGSALLGFFLMPLILPTVIAGYAVVGERDQGTLEPVLTTPVRRSELLMGKALAAIVPATGVAYVLFAIFLTLVATLSSHDVEHVALNPALFVPVIVFIPLLATFSIWVGLAISARSSDVRVAQQLAALAMLPMVGVLWLFAFGVIAPTLGVAIGGAAILIALDLGAWRIVSALFDPERLLTRYGAS